MKIQTLRLAAADLARCTAFYAETLGLRLISSQPGESAFQAGDSTLILADSPSRPQGVYHFAFNIPENRYEAAHTWLSERMPLLANPSGETRIFFENWNAHAAYFKDPDGNIVELIARHTLPNASHKPFGRNSILCVSEIGIATQNVPETVKRMKQEYGLDIYLSGSDEFAPVGDPNGLFIVVKEGRRWYPDLKNPAPLMPVEVTFLNEHIMENIMTPYRLVIDLPKI